MKPFRGARREWLSAKYRFDGGILPSAGVYIVRPGHDEGVNTLQRCFLEISIPNSLHVARGATGWIHKSFLGIEL